MALRKSTLRRLPPFTRKLARDINEAEKYLNRIKKVIPDIARLEMESDALLNRKKFYGKGEVSGKDLSELEQSMLNKATKNLGKPKQEAN